MKNKISLILILIIILGIPSFSYEPTKDNQQKISSPVLEIINELSDKKTAPEKLTNQFQQIDKKGRIQLYIKYSSNPAKLAEDILNSGGQVDLTSEPMSLIQAWIPYGRIKALASKDYITQISLPDYAVTKANDLNLKIEASPGKSVNLRESPFTKTMVIAVLAIGFYLLLRK